MKNGKIYATKCVCCNKLYFPPVADCGICGSTEVNWIELSGEGEIITYSKVFLRPASFSNEPPYTVVISKLKEGVKILAWLSETKFDKVKIGMKVKVKANITEDGRLIYQFFQVEEKQ